MKKIIAVDFDGTLCENKYPEIGKPNMDIINYVLENQNDNNIILWTCRCEKELRDAILWCENFGIKFYKVNENCPERIKLFKYDSRKISADIYIDDKNLDLSRLRR